MSDRPTEHFCDLRFTTQITDDGHHIVVAIIQLDDYQFPVGSLSVVVVHDAPDLFEEWKHLMRQAVTRTMMTCGISRVIARTKDTTEPERHDQ